MKKILLFSAFSAAVLTGASFIACNSVEEPIGNLNTVENNDFCKDLVEPLEPSAIHEDLLYYINEEYANFNSRAVLPAGKWDTSKAVQVSSAKKDVKMQAVPSKYNENNLISVAYTKNNVSCIVSIEETGTNEFTLLNENGSKLIKMKYNPETGTATCTEVISKKDLEGFLCNGAMAVLGWEVAVSLSVPSGGSSLAFGVLWSVVTYVAC